MSSAPTLGSYLRTRGISITPLPRTSRLVPLGLLRSRSDLDRQSCPAAAFISYERTLSR